jgi:drug/metabolite transporter (DMT)-like permease
MLKYSELPLIKQSAIITLMSRFGYLIGLVWAGESIVTMQWAGVVVMLVGTILTNYH